MNAIRRKQVREALSLAHPEASWLLVSAPENRRYLSGFTGSAGLLLLGPERTLLIADGRYWAQAETQCPDLELVRFRAEEHASLLACALGQVPAGQPLAVEGRHLTLADAPALQGHAPVATESLVEHVRQRKDPAELELMRRAIQIADRAWLQALELLKPGLREVDFCLELEYQMQKLGARKPSFDSIVASGPNGAFPHAGVGERVIERGELITIDFGAHWQGYNSDMTRTVWLGTLAEPEARIYRAVRNAQALAVAAVRPGLTCRELDAVAREALAQDGLAEYFSHGLGHGIGLAVHELPGVRSVSETVLEPGMVITIEPGVYVPGHTGCRIEDMVLVTESGGEKLNRSAYQDLDQTHPLEAAGA